VEVKLVNQCAILYVKPDTREETHVLALRALGFAVDVAGDLPSAEILSGYHAIVVRVSEGRMLPGLGAHLRAKPRFGRRVLVALVPPALGERERRDGVVCGFDVVLPDTCTTRDLAANILRRLRPDPEYRCLLRSPTGRRTAA
jgi:hypothetical protein